MIGLNVEKLMRAEDRIHHQGYVDKYLESGIGAIIGRGPREVRGQHKDGSTFPLELSVSEMRVGEHQTFIGTLRDITERRLVED
jgi:two-component system sensor kinase FixL